MPMTMAMMATWFISITYSLLAAHSWQKNSMSHSVRLVSFFVSSHKLEKLAIITTVSVNYHMMPSSVTPTPRKKKPALPAVPAIVVRGVKGAVAAECLNKISGKDLNNTAQERKIFEYFHGEGNVVSQLEKFMKGQDVYDNIWIKEETKNGPQEVFPEKLHCHPGKRIVANENMTRTLLERTHSNKPNLMTGRGLRNQADKCAREAKKMISLMPEAVKAKILEPPVNGEYSSYASGKNEDDLLEFLKFCMYNWGVS